MEKPTSVKLNEFKTNMVSLINTSGLPLFVIEPVLKDILSIVETQAEQQYLREKAAYDESLKEVERTDQND